VCCVFIGVRASAYVCVCMCGWVGVMAHLHPIRPLHLFRIFQVLQSAWPCNVAPYKIIVCIYVWDEDTPFPMVLVTEYEHVCRYQCVYHLRVCDPKRGGRGLLIVLRISIRHTRPTLSILFTYWRYRYEMTIQRSILDYG